LEHQRTLTGPLIESEPRPKNINNLPVAPHGLPYPKWRIRLIIGGPKHREHDVASPSASPSIGMRCPVLRSISMMPWPFRRRAAVVVDGASATSRGGTDAPISTATNGAIYSLQRACKAPCATLTAGSHEGRPCEPPRKHWRRAPAMLQQAAPSHSATTAPPLYRCDHLRPRNRHGASPRVYP